MIWLNIIHQLLMQNNCCFSYRCHHAWHRLFFKKTGFVIGWRDQQWTILTMIYCLQHRLALIVVLIGCNLSDSWMKFFWLKKHFVGCRVAYCSRSINNFFVWRCCHWVILPSFFVCIMQVTVIFCCRRSKQLF